MAKAATTHVIEIETGIGEPAFIPLTLGQELQPISVGKKGMWRIESPRVLDVHAFVYFDGNALFLQSADEANGASVDGFKVGKAWTELHAPCRIEVGGARLRYRSLLAPAPMVDAAPADAGPPADDAATAAMARPPVHGVPGGGPGAPPNPNAIPSRPPAAGMPPDATPTSFPKDARPFRPGEFSRGGDEDESTRVAPLDGAMARTGMSGAMARPRPADDPSTRPEGIARPGDPAGAPYAGQSAPNMMGTAMMSGPYPMGQHGTAAIPLGVVPPNAPIPMGPPNMGMQPGMGPPPMMMQPGMQPPPDMMMQSGMQPGMMMPDRSGPYQGMMPPPNGYPTGPMSTNGYPTGQQQAPIPQEVGLPRLVAEFKAFSTPKKILIFLMPFAMLCGVFVIFTDDPPPQRPQGRADAGATSAEGGALVTSGSVPNKTPAPGTSYTLAANAIVWPPSVPCPPPGWPAGEPLPCVPPGYTPPAPTTPPTVPPVETGAAGTTNPPEKRDAGSEKRDAGSETPRLAAGQKTLERQAVDLVAAGRFAEAATIYEQLAQAQKQRDPNNTDPTYREAARILRAKLDGGAP